MRKKILVTGGAGYFGQLLVERLLLAGHDVSSFDLNPCEKLSGSQSIIGDIRSLEQISDACAGMDSIFHNVAQVPLAKDKKQFFEVNELGTENTLRAALNGKVKKFVYTSSSAVFGIPKSNPVTEQTVPEPQEAYGRAKLKGELLSAEYSKKGLDVAIIRPRTILGLGRLGIFQILFEWIYEGYNIPVLGKGDNLYQFVHASDLADACILAEAKSGLNVYNCGAEKFGTMFEMLAALCLHAGTGSKVVSVPAGPTEMLMNVASHLSLIPLGPYHSMMYGRSMYFDIQKAKSELHWQPEFSNEEMIKQSYDWYVENRQIIKNAKNQSLHRSAVKEKGLYFVKKALKYWS